MVVLHGAVVKWSVVVYPQLEPQPIPDIKQYYYNDHYKLIK